MKRAMVWMAALILAASAGQMRGQGGAQTAQPPGQASPQPERKPLTQGTALPRFEVASIKPYVPGNKGTRPGFYPGGRVVLLGTVQSLLTEALNVRPFQISAGPGWASDAREDSFYIEAIAPDSSPSKESNQFRPVALLTDEQRQMLLALLIDRFQLRFHQVTKTGDVYFLVRGKGKLQLQPPADTTIAPKFGQVKGRGINIPMQDFASQLQIYMKRPVVDETGLKGSFDFQFPEELPDCDPSQCDDEEISYMLRGVSAIGLELKPGKGPVETIVIDHVEQPSPN